MLRFSLAFTVVCASAFSYGQKVTLRLNLPVGKAMKYSMTNKMVSANPGASGGMNMDMTQQMSTTISAISKTAKGQKVRTRMDDVKITAPKGSMMGNQASQTAAQLKGTSYEAIYDSRGRMVAGSMTGTGAAGRNARQMGGMNFGFLGAEFPAGPVSPGATWSTSVDFAKIMGEAVPGMATAAGGSKIPIKYKLVKVEKRGAKSVAHLNYTMIGSVNMNMGGGNQEAPAMAMKISMNMKGLILVDVSTGAPISGNSSGTTNVSIGGTMNIGQKITVSFRQL